MTPRALLFDLDDTLFDHRRSARAALAEVHTLFAPSFAFDTFERHHAHFLEEMHLEVLAGRMALDQARQERFRRVFDALGVSLNDDETRAVASAYRQGYVTARQPIAGAEQLLAAAHEHARIAIVSNNLLDEQRDKLDFCGLTPFVDALVVSEDVGMSKPDPAIFRIALSRLGASGEGATMIGDSWFADIEGAVSAGIRAVWFNPARHPRPADLRVEEIHALAPVEEVLPILLPEA